ncbi:MAG: Type 1 glutamine amidotransferase-like domain-containing protein [Reyranellaceae bacterium]
MRLYLSSFRLGNRPEELRTLVGAGRRAAVIVNALDHRPRARPDWLADQSQALSALGFDVRELDLRDHFGTSGSLPASLAGLDLVWINGGNTFVLRRAMRQSGFDLAIRDAVARDALVYAGFSAGAVIAAPGLRGLDLTDDPREVPAGYGPEIVWDGLGFLPFSLVVHFKSDHPESASVDREVALYEAEGLPYRTLRDGEALVVAEGTHRIVGSPGTAPGR